VDHVLQHTSGLLHSIVAIAAIAFGTAVILSRKGTATHKWLGRGYVIMMVAVNITAFLLYEVFGEFGMFHWMAAFSLLTVLAGYITARSRTPGWKTRHAYFMCGSYVGLLAALAAEILTRTPGLPFLSAVAAATLSVIALGLVVMFRTIPRLL
jgi:uncharacterized membrane protein